MGLSELVRHIIITTVIESVSVSDFEQVLNLQPKAELFKLLVSRFRKEDKHNKRGLQYPSDVHRTIHRYKNELKADFDSFLNKVGLKEAVSSNSSPRFLENKDQVTDMRKDDLTCETRIKEHSLMSISEKNEGKRCVSEATLNEHNSSACLRGLQGSDIKNEPFPFREYIEGVNIKFSDRHLFLRQKLFSLGIYCVMVFKGCHLRKKPGYGRIEYAVCKHAHCRKYRLHYQVKGDYIENIEVKFDRPETFHHEEEHAYQLRGIERRKTKQRLHHLLPNSIRYEDIKNSDAEALRSGNWHKIRSLDVYQKARSEAKAELDLDKNSFLDLVLRCIREPEDQRYVQMPNGETLVYVYTKRQIELLYSRGKKFTAYFDATGSVVRPIKNGSTVYYYALVINIAGKITPVAELISSQHDSATIACFFVHLKRFITVSLRKKWPPFSCIISDWSFAIIGGMCFGFNEMTLYRYLNTVYNFIMNRSRDVSELVILRSCCAHFIKMVINKLSKIKYHKQSRKLLIEMVACLVVCESLDLLGNLFRALITVLLHSHVTSEVKASLEIFKSQRGQLDTDMLLTDLECTEKEIGEWDRERGKYSESAFYLFFFKIYEEVSGSQNAHLDGDFSLNNLKSPEFAQYILNHCMPFAPLWTGLLNPLVGEGAVRFSNSNVESWFKTVKKDILSNERRLKIGRFLEKTRERIDTVLKSIEFDIGKKVRKEKKPNKVEMEVTDIEMQLDKPLSIETWRPKKEKSKYFSLKRLEKYTAKEVHDNLNLKDQEKQSMLKSRPNQPDVLRYADFENNFVKQKIIDYVKEITYFGPEQKASNAPSTKDICSSETSLSQRCEGVIVQTPVSEMDVNSVFSFLQNGLLFSSNYYLLCYFKLRVGNIVLGFFDYEGHRLKLYISSYATLRSIYNYDLPRLVDLRERWLSDDCIDSAAYSILGHHSDIYYVDAVASKLIFMKQCDTFTTFRPFMKSLVDVQYMVIPVNIEEQHWFLLILDVKLKIVYILDSGQPAHYSIQDISDTISYFFKLRNKSNISEVLNFQEWQFFLADFVPKQADSVNCGVYILYFMSVLAQTKSIVGLKSFLGTHKDFEPERFRITLQQLLLLASVEVANDCLNCSMKVLSNYLRCNFCRRYLHSEQCTKVTSVCITNDKCSLCSACSDPFLFVKSTATVALDPLITEHFILHYQSYLRSVVHTRDTNEESRRFREINDRISHLKWDYSTAFFDISSSLDAAKALKTHICSEGEYICYVLLGIINRKIFHNYYGLPEYLYDMVTYYKEMNNLEATDLDYPSPYTLDMVLDKLEDISI